MDRGKWKRPALRLVLRGVERGTQRIVEQGTRFRRSHCDSSGGDERDVGGRDRCGAGARAGARVPFAAGVAGSLSRPLPERSAANCVAGDERAVGKGGRLGAAELHAGRVVCQGGAGGAAAGGAGKGAGGGGRAEAVLPEG